MHKNTHDSNTNINMPNTITSINSPARTIITRLKTYKKKKIELTSTWLFLATVAQLLD